MTQAGTQTSPESAKAPRFNVGSDPVAEVTRSPQRMSPKISRKERSPRGARNRKSRSPVVPTRHVRCFFPRFVSTHHYSYNITNRIKYLLCIQSAAGALICHHEMNDRFQSRMLQAAINLFALIAMLSYCQVCHSMFLELCFGFRIEQHQQGFRDQEPARLGMSPSTAECLRAVFAANLWHQGLVHDAMACASFLKFHPNLPKQHDHVVFIGGQRLVLG